MPSKIIEILKPRSADSETVEKVRLSQLGFLGSSPYERFLEGIFVGGELITHFDTRDPHESDTLYIGGALAFEFPHENMDGLAEEAQVFYKQEPIMMFLRKMGRSITPDEQEEFNKSVRILMEIAKKSDRYVLCFPGTDASPIVLILQEDNTGVVMRSYRDGWDFLIHPYNGYDM